MSIFPLPLLLVFFSYLLCPVASQTGHYGPKEVKSGQCTSAELIGTAADCQAAAMVLGLKGTVNSESVDAPPGCGWYRISSATDTGVGSLYPLISTFNYTHF